MRELIYYVAVSVDGFIATPDGGFDAFLVEGDHMQCCSTSTATPFRRTFCRLWASSRRALASTR